MQGYVKKPRTHLIENSCEQLMQLTSCRPGVHEGGELSNGDTTTTEYRYLHYLLSFRWLFLKSVGIVMDTVSYNWILICKYRDVNRCYSCCSGIVMLKLVADISTRGFDCKGSVTGFIVTE
jgi:hypothetical protein